MTDWGDVSGSFPAAAEADGPDPVEEAADEDIGGLVLGNPRATNQQRAGESAGIVTGCVASSAARGRGGNLSGVRAMTERRDALILGFGRKLEGPSGETSGSPSNGRAQREQCVWSP